MLNWKYFGVIHKAIYRLSGGRLGSRMGRIEVALVETVGRKSGKPRTAPIACYPYKGTVVVSASNSGLETPPAWYLNMQANPKVTVQLGRERFQAHAEAVPDEDREALWKVIVEINPHQGEYLANTGRKIPLMWFNRD